MRLAVLILFAFSAPAAVIQGVVLEEETGNPLSRTVVNLIPISGAQAGAVSVRSGDRGAFALNNIAAGWYVLRCTRRGFVPAEVGQLRPGRPGMPFEVTAGAQSSFFQVRMKRLGAVTGSVLDENGVGIPDWPVQVFSARKPVRRIGESKTNDRGNYRIGELEAGSYLVRSGGGSLEDESYLLPTWYKYGTAVESAEPAKVRVAETAADVVIRPVKGRMVQLSGVFTSQAPAVLTMITDTGRKVLASSSGPPVAFEASVSPGPVEFVAEGSGGAPCGAYVRMLADHNMQGIRVACGPLEVSYPVWTPPARVQFPLTMRRVDLDGTSQPRAFRGREPLLPGHWEFHALTNADYYVKSIALQANGHAETSGDGWFGIDIGNGAPFAVTLSNKPASVSGVVTSGGQPVVGAAVYLEMYDPEAANPRLDLIQMRSDAQGMYRFSGLAPGHYRVLSSFDFDPEDRLAMEKAAVLSLKEGDSTVQALELVLP